MYRADMFETAGIQEQPRSVEQLTDALRTLKAYYGKDRPNYYPFSGRNSGAFTEAFLANDRIEDGTVRGVYNNGGGYDIYSPGYKEYVEWYKLLYDEKLIDPEFAAGAANESSWETKMLTGSASVTYDHYSRPSWFMLNGGPENDPDYEMAVMPYLLDSSGNQSKRAATAPYQVNQTLVINAKSADKAADILRFHDYFWGEEGSTLANWGVEGVSYKETSGDKQYIIDYGTEISKPEGEKRWSFYSVRTTYAMPKDTEAFFEFNTESDAEILKALFSDQYLQVYPILIYTSEQSVERANLNAKVKELVNGEFVRFVTGKRPLSEWDAYLNEMEQAGYKKITEIDQAAYDAMYK